MKINKYTIIKNQKSKSWAEDTIINILTLFRLKNENQQMTKISKITQYTIIKNQKVGRKIL